MMETQNSINVFLIYHIICVLNDSFVSYVVFELLAISGWGWTSLTQAVRGLKSPVLLGLTLTARGGGGEVHPPRTTFVRVAATIKIFRRDYPEKIEFWIG